MPEGPELFLSSQFVNKTCQGRCFSGKVIKSAVSTKNPDVEWDSSRYTISAVSRGKEMKLTLTDISDSEGKDKKTSLDIVFRFGMSGTFKFVPEPEMHKHAHLNFFTQNDDPKMVLSFIDVRRFGRWEPNGGWSKERGPCVLQEYEAFRENILSSLDNVAFNRPICEAMLNQRFFNGVGNYLRAEALYRTEIPPFVKARTVLESLVSDVKKDNLADLVYICHKLAKEVSTLSGGKGYNPEPKEDLDMDAFSLWLQCYYQPGMKTLSDHNGRTIWFKGEAGPMAPKDGKSRGRKGGGKKNSKSSSPESATEKKGQRGAKIEVLADDLESKGEEAPKRRTRKVTSQKSGPTKKSFKNELKEECTETPDNQKGRGTRKTKIDEDLGPTNKLIKVEPKEECTESLHIQKDIKPRTSRKTKTKQEIGSDLENHKPSSRKTVMNKESKDRTLNKDLPSDQGHLSNRRVTRSQNK